MKVNRWTLGAAVTAVILFTAGCGAGQEQHHNVGEADQYHGSTGREAGEQGSLSKKGSEHGHDAQAAAYACSMKCEGDKTYSAPGNCPVCGMKLRKVMPGRDGHDGAGAHHDEATGWEAGEQGSSSEKGSEHGYDAQAAAYACLMKCEGDKTYSAPGNYPVCGMKLKKVMPGRDGHVGAGAHHDEATGREAGDQGSSSEKGSEHGHDALAAAYACSMKCGGRNRSRETGETPR